MKPTLDNERINLDETYPGQLEAKSRWNLPRISGSGRTESSFPGVEPTGSYTLGDYTLLPSSKYKLLSKTILKLWSII